MVLNFQNSPLLRLNMTGNFKVTFILPPEVEFISSLDEEEFMVGKSEDGRTTAFRNYNSPIDLPKNSWTILFDTISWRNFFTFQWYNILLLVIAAVVLATVKRFYQFKSKMDTMEAILEISPLVALLTVVCRNGGKFLVLGWFHWLVIMALGIEIVLSIMAVVFWVQIYKKRALIKSLKRV